jgi:HAD superfamily hydrolase (TIGR01549 family)
MGQPYRGVLLDLFGTLIGFDPARLPTLVVDGREVRSTVGGLHDLLEEWVPGTSPGSFLQALASVSEEMARARIHDQVELPSRERFRRALQRVRCEEAVLREAAVHLSRAHMAGIAAATVLPPAHVELLRGLRPRYRLGVVSNFDDTAAAYDILMRHDVVQYLDTVVVSEAVGLRKPHPAVLRAGLRGLGLPANEVLFVGDTFGEDVAGAQAAGVDAAWIDATGAGVPAGAAAPRWVVQALPELSRILDGP